MKGACGCRRNVARTRFECDSALVPDPRTSPAPPASVAGRLLGAAQWLVPSVLLALTPKCPVCLAAYVTVGTGIGLSLPTAAFLRTTMLLGGGAALAFLVARLLFRLVAHRGEPRRTPS